MSSYVDFAFAAMEEGSLNVVGSGDEPATLHQSILHAAFTGRLVPQDPADEPAAALLARLRADPAVPRRTRKQARAA